MPAQVLDRNEISINKLLYKTTGDVQVALASQKPGKLTIGDYTDASNPLASEKSYSDWQGGILVEVGDPAKDQDRAFFGDAQLRFNGHLLLPRLATLTNGFPSQADVGVLIEFNNAALKEINKTRSDLKKPIREKKLALQNALDEGYSNLHQGQATLKAYLASVVEVVAAQDEILQKVGVIEQRNQAMDAIIKASSEAADLTVKINSTADAIKPARSE